MSSMDTGKDRKERWPCISGAETCIPLMEAGMVHGSMFYPIFRSSELRDCGFQGRNAWIFL